MNGPVERALVVLGVAATVLGGAMWWSGRSVPPSRAGGADALASPRRAAPRAAAQPTPVEAAPGRLSTDAPAAPEPARSGSMDEVAEQVTRAPGAAPGSTAASVPADLPPSSGRTAKEQQVYDELVRVLPLKERAMEELAAAAEHDSSMDHIQPYIDKLLALDTRLQELAPDAFVRTEADGRQMVRIDSERLREAAGGTLPNERPLGTVEVRAAGGDDGAAPDVDVRVDRP